jgi:hypothetical protein
MFVPPIHAAVSQDVVTPGLKVTIALGLPEFNIE